ncbi:MAG: histidine phosphatase family protein [Pseudomonadota bacterium]
MRLLLARHGETTWNRDGRYQGRSDPLLSAWGEVQAQALARRFSATEKISIVASPLMRAQATAHIIANRLNLPVATDHCLIELGYGDWEGLQQTAVKLKWPELLRQWKRTPHQVTFPGGESLKDLQQRVQSFLERMAECSGTILAITHDGVVRMAVLEAWGQPLSAFRDIRIENASVTTFIWEGGKCIVEDMNDVAHLFNLTKDTHQHLR